MQRTILVCPDCGTTFDGVDSARCSYGHVELKLDLWPICECGHGSHYDMTTFCLTDGCECEAWVPSEKMRQITRRPV